MDQEGVKFHGSSRDPFAALFPCHEGLLVRYAYRPTVKLCSGVLFDPLHPLFETGAHPLIPRFQIGGEPNPVLAM